MIRRISLQSLISTGEGGDMKRLEIFRLLIVATTIGMCSLVLSPFQVSAANCPAGTVYVGEDEDYLYCKRLGDYVGDDQATRAAIIRNAMKKVDYVYHRIPGRCLTGDVSICPTSEHPMGCYDCSALVFDVLRSVGVWVEPNAHNQYLYFKGIPDGLKFVEPIYGDVIFIQNDKDSKIDHTGIYVGTRDGRIYYINASSRKGKVTVSATRSRPFAYGNVSVLRVGKID